MIIHFTLGAVHKRHPQSGGILAQCGADILGSFQMQTSALFGPKKSLDFLKFMVCPGQGWTVKFSRFVRTSFMDIVCLLCLSVRKVLKL